MNKDLKDTSKLSIADRLRGNIPKATEILKPKEATKEIKGEKSKQKDPVDEIQKSDDEKHGLEISSNLQDYLNRAISEEEFNFNKNSVYVDDDIHEVFLRIKKTQKVNISKLVSVILKDFILAHRAEIEEIVSKKNRFIT